MEGDREDRTCTCMQARVLGNLDHMEDMGIHNPLDLDEHTDSTMPPHSSGSALAPLFSVHEMVMEDNLDEGQTSSLKEILMMQVKLLMQLTMDKRIMETPPLPSEWLEVIHKNP